MHHYPPPTRTRIILVQHPAALIPKLLIDAWLCGLACLLGTVSPTTPLLWCPLALMLVWVFVHVWHWWTFRLVIADGWITVRETHYGIMRSTTYPPYAIQAIHHYQGPLGMLCDSGTLVLRVAPQRTRSFPSLTSYALLRTVLTAHGGRP